MKPMTRIVLVGAAALGLLGMAGTAQARNDVYWSVGVGAPGVAIGVGNAPPMVYTPPIYVRPRPVYVAPPPAYYYQPAPVYYGPPVVVRPGRGYYRGQRHWRRWHHRHHHRDWDDD